jgi:hypothetical protein
MVILQVIIAMISIFIVFFQCSPTKALWDPMVGGKCWPPHVLNDFSYFLSAYTTMTDFVLAIVPISAFWKLQMRFSTKIGLCIMVGLTMLSAVVTLIKATYLHLFTDTTDPRKLLLRSERGANSQSLQCGHAGELGSVSGGLSSRRSGG